MLVSALLVLADLSSEGAPEMTVLVEGDVSYAWCAPTSVMHCSSPMLARTFPPSWPRFRRLREALAPFAAIAAHFEEAGIAFARHFGLDPEELHVFRFVPDKPAVALRLSDCKRAKEVLP